MASADVLLPGADVTLFDDRAAVAQATADSILAAADEAIERDGRFRLCLAGGTTPDAAYGLLAGRHADWSRWWIYHGDERCLPIAHPERNSHAADQAWLNRVRVPREQVFAIPAEIGAEAGALAYEPIVEGALPFDLVLLGIGEDGHTASLFPGRAVLENRLVMPVHDSPKPPPDRVSLTTAAFAQSRQLLILVTGGGKADAIRRWSEGEPLPVVQVANAAPCRVLIDRAAAAPLI
jgi:6-phosphogluconolactonase